MRPKETNGRKNRQSIDRHIAQEIQKGSNAQSGDSQGTTAAEAGRNGTGHHHHDQGPEADSQQEKTQVVSRYRQVSFQERNERRPRRKAETAEKVKGFCRINLPM